MIRKVTNAISLYFSFSIDTFKLFEIAGNNASPAILATSTLGNSANTTIRVEPNIPISNWAIYLGIFLIAAFTFIRFKR